MDNPNLIEIKFVGDGIAPERIKASELGEILIAIEKMLTPLIDLQNKEEDSLDEIDSDSITIAMGLTHIVKGSLCLQFSSTIPEEASRAFRELTNRISKGEVYHLPESSIQGLQSISKFTQKRNCSGEFYLLNGRTEMLTRITPEMKFELPKMLMGETVLYGTVIAVGGRKPKIRLDVDNRIIICDANQEIVKNLGKRIDTFVGLKGNAKWDAETLKLISFTITDVDSEEIESELQWQETLPLLGKSGNSCFDELASKALAESLENKTMVMGFDEL